MASRNRDREIFKPKTLRKYDGYELNDKVALKKKREGVIKYIGRVKDKKSYWFGIEITNTQLGKHNGTLDGVEYFKAKSHKGVFVQSKDIKKKLLDTSTNSRKKATSSVGVKVPRKHKRTESTPTDIASKDKLKKRKGPGYSKKKSVPVADVC